MQEIRNNNNGDISREAVPLLNGDAVAIIGAGNVAMDSARTALRMGAESVTVIYRGTRENMPALKTEYNEALEEGVQFMWESTTVECIGEDISTVNHCILNRRTQANHLHSSNF